MANVILYIFPSYLALAILALATLALAILALPWFELLELFTFFCRLPS